MFFKLNDILTLEIMVGARAAQGRSNGEARAMHSALSDFP